MKSNKVIFVSLPRSGSSYMCQVVEECFASKNIEFLKTNSEISNISQWTTNNNSIIDEHIDTIKHLNLDTNCIDSVFVNRIFLHYITQPKPIILKFFPFDSFDFSIDELIAVTKRHNIRLFCLYRKNLLDSLISRIVKNQVDIIGTIDESSLLNSNFKFSHSIIEHDIIGAHQLFCNIYKKLHDQNIVESVIEYEQLTFDPVLDSNILHNSLCIEGDKQLTTKLTTSNIKQKVLETFPSLKDDLIRSLRTSNLPIKNDFYFSLNS